MNPDRYFDYAASCPPFPEALDALARVAVQAPGNPSSHHDAGFAARDALEQGRRDFMDLCGLRDGGLVLTSGATEANNAVIRGVMRRFPKGRLALAADVHASAYFARDEFKRRTDLIPLGSDGQATVAGLKRAVARKTVLCSVLHGNNETGIVHDVSDLARFCVDRGILFHCDGVQAVGHIPLELNSMPFHFYTFSAHKFGAPRGVGGILLRDETFTPQILGGEQEDGLRAGTENPAGLAAAVTALRSSLDGLDAETTRLRNLARALLDELRANVPDVLLNSNLEKGLPGLVSLSFPGAKGAEIVTEMNLAGFAISSGSACHSSKLEAPRVIRAMGRPDRDALGTVRISMGRHTNADTVHELAHTLAAVVERQRALA